MNYGSICSGVEAATLAWAPLGWTAKFFAEVEPFPSAVLQQKFGATKPLRPLIPEEAQSDKDRKIRESWAKQIAELPDSGTLPNLGDFTKISTKDYDGTIDLLVGGTPCFPAGNMVLTEHGYIPIEKIRIGDRVMTHKGHLRRVLAAGSSIADNIGVCRIVGRPAFHVTQNHPFLIAHGKRNHSRKSPDYARLQMSNPDFKPIGENQGNFAAYLNVHEHPCDVSRPELPEVYSANAKQIFELCGWYLGDGYVRCFAESNKKAVILCLSAKKLEIFAKHFDGIVHYSKSMDKNGVYKTQIACTVLADFLMQWFGHRAGNKHIPAWVYGLPNEHRQAFMTGYRLTDGCLYNKTTGYTTISKSLAYGVADLCSFSSVTYVSSSETTEICGCIVNQKPWWRISSYPAKTSRQLHRFGRWLFGRIRKFEKIEKPETVYNMEVEDDNSYICNGLCVHNCQSYSVAGLRKGLADPRGNLALEFVKLAYRTGVRWTCWENVPGITSSSGGKDFASFLSLLCGWEVDVPKDGWRKCGIVTPAPGCFGLAWRILDAQYTRVPQFPRAIPQRRRRLFVIGYLDSWEYPAKVLFDGEMRGGDSPPRRTKGQAVAAGTQSGTVTAESIRERCGSPGGGKGILQSKELSLTLATGNDQKIITFPDVECLDMRQVEVHDTGIAPTLIATDYKGGEAVSFYPYQQKECSLEECSNTLINGDSPGHQNAVAVTETDENKDTVVCFENHGNDSRVTESKGISPTITSRSGTGGNNLPLVMTADDPIGFIKNDAGGEQQGFWNGVFPTVRSQVIPAVAYNVSFCDANGTRKDRPDGGLYVTEAETSKTVTAGGTNAETVIIDPVALDGDKMAKAERKGGSGLGISTDGVMYTQTVKDVHAVAYEESLQENVNTECVPLDLRNATRDPEKHDEMNRQGVGVGADGEPMNTVTAGSVPGVGWQATVRRLLPVECERLMGFPDGHTLIKWKGKPESECPDAPRYKACGNSMCVNVMAWIGQRIDAVEKEIRAEASHGASVNNNGDVNE